MKPLDSSIKTLVDLAIQHYQEHLKPNQYAASAAFAFASTMAAEHRAESADAAAFVAAMEDASANIYYAHHLAYVANEASKAHMAMKHYRIQATENAEKTTQPTASDSFFKSAFKKPSGPSVGQDALEHYRSIRSEETSEAHDLALNTAFAHYSHVHAVSFAAYVHAVAIAARYTEENQRAVFEQAMTTRLSLDLNHEPVSPGLFMRILCSETVNVIGIVLLTAGLLMLTTGIAGLAIGTATAMTVSVGLNPIFLVITGGINTSIGASVFAGRFFMAQQKIREDALSEAAVASICDVRFEKNEI